MEAMLETIKQQIDAVMAKKEYVIVAIDGPCTSGKTTMAAKLAEIYDCNVFHMDDFFLRPEQRTPERFAEAGGNVDYERFREEVLLPLTAHVPFSYRPFDCSSFTVTDGYDVTPAALTVVEGSYSMHPALGKYYDLAVWVDIDAQTQRARIETRNSPAFAARFFTEWIPMEQAYFAAFHTAAQCDIRLEVQL